MSFLGCSCHHVYSVDISGQRIVLVTHTFCTQFSKITQKADDISHLLPLHIIVHLPHAGVSTAVRGAAVDVIAEHVVLEDEDGDVGHGAQVHVLPHLVLDETLVDERVEDQLQHSCEAEKRKE